MFGKWEICVGDIGIEAIREEKFRLIIDLKNINKLLYKTLKSFLEWKDISIYTPIYA